MAPGCIFQIFLWVTVQNQIGIAQRVIVDKVVQFRLLCHSHIQSILNPGAVNGNFSPILESQLHAPGIHVERTGLASYFIIASSNSRYRLTVYDKASEFCDVHGSLHCCTRRKRKIRTLLQSETGSDFSCLVGAGGFEPPKLKAADLQSVPIGHSGTRPYTVFCSRGLPVYITTRERVCQLLFTAFSGKSGCWTAWFSRGDGRSGGSSWRGGGHAGR